MPDYSLVPVDHQPDFSDVSLVPVDHDPFSDSSTVQQAQLQPVQAQTQPAQPQPENPTQRLAASAAPIQGDVNAALPEAYQNPNVGLGAVLARAATGLVTLPQRAIDAAKISAAHDYGPSPDVMSDSDAPFVDPLPAVAAETALTMMGGSSLVPVRTGMVLGANRVARGVAAEATNGHHPWPMYLGGAVKQDLVPLPRSLHVEFHRRLDEYLPKQRGTAYYESLSPTKRQEALQTLAEQTKKFDAEHGTKLYDALLKNGFPEP